MSHPNDHASRETSNEEELRVAGHPVETHPQHKMSSLAKSGIALVSAIALVCILIIVLIVRTQPIQVEYVQYSDEQFLDNMLESSFYQPIQLSAENEFAHLSVQGIVADEQRLFLLYTAKDKRDETNSLIPRVFNENGEPIIDMASFGETHVWDDEIEVEVADFHLFDGENMPERLLVRVGDGDNSLELTIPVDTELFQNTMEEIIVDEQVSSAGQTIIISEMLISPLQISLTVEYPLENTKEISRLVNIKLVDRHGNARSSFASSREAGETNGIVGTTKYIFNGYATSPLEDLVVVWEGMLMADKDDTIVVDLAAGQVLEAPDGRIELHDAQLDSQGWDLTFMFSDLDENEFEQLRPFFSREFVDAAGNEYVVADPGGMLNRLGLENDKSAELSLLLPDEDYVQPLTFSLLQYPGYVEDPVEVLLQ